MNEKYLPIGTVVTLKEAIKPVMIVGYLPMSKDGQIYDYNACTFPEGILSADKTLAFNHNKISKINHKGLENNEYQKFNNQVKEIVEKQIEPKQSKLINQEGTSNSDV